MRSSVISQKFVPYKHAKLTTKSFKFPQHLLAAFTLPIQEHTSLLPTITYAKQHSNTQNNMPLIYLILGIAAIRIAEEESSEPYRFSYAGDVNCGIVMPFWKKAVKHEIWYAKQFQKKYNSEQNDYYCKKNGKISLQILQFLLDTNPRKSYPTCTCGTSPCRYRNKLSKIPDYEQELKDAMARLRDTLELPHPLDATEEAVAFFRGAMVGNGLASFISLLCPTGVPALRLVALAVLLVSTGQPSFWQILQEIQDPSLERQRFKDAIYAQARDIAQYEREQGAKKGMYTAACCWFIYACYYMLCTKPHAAMDPTTRTIVQAATDAAKQKAMQASAQDPEALIAEALIIAAAKNAAHQLAFAAIDTEQARIVKEVQAWIKQQPPKPSSTPK